MQAKKWGFKPSYTTATAVAQPSAADAVALKGQDRYATSKAANVIWAFALGERMARQAEHAGKTVLAFDPGLMFNTSLSRRASPAVQWLNRTIAPYTTRLMRLLVNENVNTPAESGGNLAWLVMSEETKGLKAVYYEKRKVRESSEQSKDEKVQNELLGWRFLARMSTSTMAASKRMHQSHRCTHDRPCYLPQTPRNLSVETKHHPNKAVCTSHHALRHHDPRSDRIREPSTHEVPGGPILPYDYLISRPLQSRLQPITPAR